MSGVSIHDGAAWVTVIMNVGLPLLHAGRLLRAVHFDTLRRTPLQAGIIGILSQASQSHLNLRLQRGVFSNHAAERPFKAWC